jgi:hypothetical protein
LANASIQQPNLIIIQLIVVTYSSEQQHLFSRWQQLQKPHDVRSQEKPEGKKPLLSGVCVNTGLEIAEDSGKRSPVVLKGNPPVGVKRAVVHCCVPLRGPSI